MSALLLSIILTSAFAVTEKPRAISPVKPVSISYQKVQQCFPEIQDERLSFKVELSRLKELSDARFVTTSSVQRLRKIHYQDSEQQLRNLILRVISPVSRKPVTELTLQTVDAKGVIVDQALTANQRLNPSQDVINNLLLGSKILSDESWHHDTKLKGMTATSKRNFKDVFEYELVDSKGKRRLLCEQHKDLGIICTCSKK